MPYAGIMTFYQDLCPLPVSRLPNEERRRTGYLQVHSDMDIPHSSFQPRPEPSFLRTRPTTNLSKRYSHFFGFFEFRLGRGPTPVRHDGAALHLHGVLVACGRVLQWYLTSGHALSAVLAHFTSLSGTFKSIHSNMQCRIPPCCHGPPNCAGGCSE